MKLICLSISHSMESQKQQGILQKIVITPDFQVRQLKPVKSFKFWISKTPLSLILDYLILLPFTEELFYRSLLLPILFYETSSFTLSNTIQAIWFCINHHSYFDKFWVSSIILRFIRAFVYGFLYAKFNSFCCNYFLFLFSIVAHFHPEFFFLKTTVPFLFHCANNLIWICISNLES